METVNPATGETIRTYQDMAPDQIRGLLEKAARAWPAWKSQSPGARADRLRRAADILKKKSEEYGRLMTLEMGKPLAKGVNESEKCAWVCEYYAEHGARFLEPERVTTDARESFVAFEPLGTILAIMPWNFPFWQVFRAAAPALMAGNVMVLKHASNVTGCALAIEAIFRDAGFPEGVFQTLVLGSRETSELIESPLIQAVTLTGSVGAGRAVGSQAGKALKKAVLELGGSDAYVILEDADLEKTAKTCAYSRLINGGQSCIAAKRFIVVENVRAEFERLLVEAMKSYKMGDPLEEGVEIGPMARADLRDSLHRQVEDSVKKGARLLLGGQIPRGPGAFYPPTVLTEVKKGMPAYDEETFGPVAAVIPARDEKDAVEKANDSVFGLGAAVFTGDMERGLRIAQKELQAGACFVNAFVRSDPRLPFGGIKESGFGRELGIYGIREFVNIKTVYAE